MIKRNPYCDLPAATWPPEDSVDPDELYDCWCGSLEQWQSATGKWHCLRCNPPPRIERQKRRDAMRKQAKAEELI